MPYQRQNFDSMQLNEDKPLSASHLKLMEDGILEAQEIANSKAGKKSASGGEIFGDYANNQALELGSAFGEKSKALGFASFATGAKKDASGEYPKDDDGNEIIPDYAWRYNEAVGDGSMSSGMGAVAFGRASKSLGYRTQTGYPPISIQNNYPTYNGYVHAPTTLSESDTNRVNDGSYAQAAVAIGSDTIALGNNSFAGGFLSIAREANSLAFGYGAETLIARTTAFGYYTKANVQHQTVVGILNDYECDVDKKFLFVVGNGTEDEKTKVQTRSNAFTVDKDGNAVISGYLNVANGLNVRSGAVSVGGTLSASDGLFRADADGNVYAAGNVNAVGFNLSGDAIIKGAISSASGKFSVSNQGNVTIAGSSSNNSFFEMTGTTSYTNAQGGTTTIDNKPFYVKSNGSICAGNQAIAEAHYSFAFGTWDAPKKDNDWTPTYTKATGQGSFACGQASQALALAAFSAGRFTKASKSYSSAFGLNTETGRDAQTAVGQYNSVSSTALFVVGNGTSAKPSNALEVDTSGNTTISGQLKFNSIDNASAQKVRCIREEYGAEYYMVKPDFNGQIMINYFDGKAEFYISASNEWLHLGSLVTD